MISLALLGVIRSLPPELLCLLPVWLHVIGAVPCGVSVNARREAKNAVSTQERVVYNNSTELLIKLTNGFIH